MNFEVVKLEGLSGKETSIYTVFVEELETTLFDRFLLENAQNYPVEIQNLIDRLETIAHNTGARNNFFREKEGKPGDGVCALFDIPDHNLRLYCIRYGMNLVILGGGGEKNVQAWQDDEKLSEEAKLMIKISKEIYQRQLDGDIKFINDGKDFEGDLIFEK
ncbi:MAG: hypothetical protein AB8F94_28265 [Saprospiraceae bacterium]